MTDRFEPAFLERQQAVYPDHDVRIYAAAVREMAARRRVDNWNGLLVHWLRRAEKARRARCAENAAAERVELQRYAEFWASLLELVALRGITPGEVSRCLETARHEGFPKLNAPLSKLLASYGQRWPGDTVRMIPVPPPSRAAAATSSPRSNGKA